MTAFSHADIAKSLKHAGFTRAIDDPKQPHPRLLSVFNALEARRPGFHDELLASGEREKLKALLKVYQDRHMEIVNEERDPLRFGWRVPAGKVVDAELARIREVANTVAVILALGGNRAAKSHDAARRIIRLMVDKPGARIAVLCPSQGQAREVAMRYLWAHFPYEWKAEQTGKQKHGAQGSYSYSLKTGFTEEAFTFQNGSSLIFKYYVDGNVKNWEGGEYDAVWADEEVTQDWVDAAMIRLGTRRGWLLLTFTPISGMSPVVDGIQSECSVVERRDGRSDLLQDRKLAGLPVLERSASKSIVYFWPKDNPYGGYQALENLAISEKWPASLIMCRLFGIAHRIKSAAFPTFSYDVHGWEPTPKFLEALHQDCRNDQKPTWVQVIDPCKGRPFAMTWWLVLPGMGNSKPLARCVREWPQQGDYIPNWGDPGEWALPSKDGRLKDGMRGPAQEPQGHTIEFMHDEMDRVEHELAVEFEGNTEPCAQIEIYQKIMDCRGGSDTQMGAVVSQDLIDAFKNDRSNGKPGRWFEDSSGKNLNPSSHRSSDGIHLINDWLGYNHSAPVDPLNEPRMKFHKRCKNIMWAMKHFTGADGPEAACKDWIDNAHYFVRADPYPADGADWIIDTGRRCV
jgi:phage terminase large subunit-like protein